MKKTLREQQLQTITERVDKIIGWIPDETPRKLTLVKKLLHKNAQSTKLSDEDLENAWKDIASSVREWLPKPATANWQHQILEVLEAPFPRS